jgi:hypothetical protein
MCDVCGRTLLRGERAHAYLDGATRRSVCELCTARAMQEGWVREGTERPLENGRGANDRRRSLLGRLRRRERRPAVEEYTETDEFSEPGERRSLLSRLRSREDELAAHDGESDREETAPAPARMREPRPAREPARERAPREPVREPRHVRAIPTSTEQKFVAAIDAFNGSEHRRTVAGVARSLGMPTVAVRPVTDRHGLIEFVVSWELCWYRYEVDLSEDVPGVRVVGQGYELDELDPAERQPNAVADDQGALSLGH